MTDTDTTIRHSQIFNPHFRNDKESNYYSILSYAHDSMTWKWRTGKEWCIPKKDAPYAVSCRCCALIAIPDCKCFQEFSTISLLLTFFREKGNPSNPKKWALSLLLGQKVKIQRMNSFLLLWSQLQCGHSSSMWCKSAIKSEWLAFRKTHSRKNE